MVGGCPDVGTDHDVGHTGFVLNREKNHALRGSRPLPHQRDASHGDLATLWSNRCRGDRQHPGRGQPCPFKG